MLPAAQMPVADQWSGSGPSSLTMEVLSALRQPQWVLAQQFCLPASTRTLHFACLAMPCSDLAALPLLAVGVNCHELQGAGPEPRPCDNLGQGS